jgi:glioma pathogenesis-related protein 2
MPNFADNHLNAHNEYRTKHGCPPLKLDEDLCKCAQDWADQLANKHAMEHRPGNKYGENIYMACDKTPDTVDGATPVKNWYNEIKFYKHGSTRLEPRCGHFTQLVWKGTTKMGVGIAKNE